MHVIDGDGSKINKEWRKLCKTSTNSSKVRSVFGDSACKILPIPKIINDYNYHIGGVDIADQLCSYYSTQLTVRRMWMPLFFWLIDTLIINSFLICKELKLCNDHKSFRLQLVCGLIKDATVNPLKWITCSED